MIGNGLAIREAAYMEVADESGPVARQRRLRIAASAVVDFLCADHKVCRAKVFSGRRSAGAVKVRRIAYAALTDAGYTPTEIARAFGHDLTTVLRGKDIPRTGDPGDVLAQLKALIADPPPLGPDARLAPVPEPKDTVQAMRRRYRRLLDAMLRATTHAHACRLWKAWCRTEYPYSWTGTAATLPIEYRLRHPDRLGENAHEPVVAMAAVGLPPMLADRFWSKVSRSDDPDACWLWTGAVNPKGYGQLTVGSRTDGSRRQATAPRVAWELTHGPIPDGQCVCHKCDTPRCCRPDHLWLGTVAQNAADMAEKGRGMGWVWERKRRAGQVTRETQTSPAPTGGGPIPAADGKVTADGFWKSISTDCVTHAKSGPGHV